MWKDDFFSIRTEIQYEIKKILGSEFEKNISEKKERMFELLNSDNEDEFNLGCMIVVFWYEDLLNEQEKERIKGIVLNKRHLITEILLWIELCDMLDIEPTKEEIKNYLVAQGSTSSEEIKQFHRRARRERREEKI